MASIDEYITLYPTNWVINDVYALALRDAQNFLLPSLLRVVNDVVRVAELLHNVHLAWGAGPNHFSAERLGDLHCCDTYATRCSKYKYPFTYHRWSALPFEVNGVRS